MILMNEKVNRYNIYGLISRRVCMTLPMVHHRCQKWVGNVVDKEVNERLEPNLVKIVKQGI